MTTVRKTPAKIVWRKPIVLDVRAIGQALGHCRAGNTPTNQGCAFGNETKGGGHYCRAGGQHSID